MPSNYEALKGVAKAYVGAGDYEKAVATQQKAIEIAKKQGVRSAKWIARDEQVLAKYQRKRKLQEEMGEKDSSDENLEKLAIAYAHDGQLDKAVGLLDRMSGFHEWSLMNKANSYSRERDYALSAVYYRVADTGYAASRVGNLYERGGYGLEKNIDAAIEWYYKAVDKGYYIAYLSLIDLYLSSRDSPGQGLDEALACAAKLEEAMPSNYEALKGVAKAYVGAGDYEKAVATQQKAIEIAKKQGVQSVYRIEIDEQKLAYYQRKREPCKN